MNKCAEILNPAVELPQNTEISDSYTVYLETQAKFARKLQMAYQTVTADQIIAQFSELRIPIDRKIISDLNKTELFVLLLMCELGQPLNPEFLLDEVPNLVRAVDEHEMRKTIWSLIDKGVIIKTKISDLDFNRSK